MRINFLCSEKELFVKFKQPKLYQYPKYWAMIYFHDLTFYIAEPMIKIYNINCNYTLFSVYRIIISVTMQILLNDRSHFTGLNLLLELFNSNRYFYFRHKGFLKDCPDGLLTEQVKIEPIIYTPYILKILFLLMDQKVYLFVLCMVNKSIFWPPSGKKVKCNTKEIFILLVLHNILSINKFYFLISGIHQNLQTIFPTRRPVKICISCVQSIWREQRKLKRNRGFIISVI